MKTEDVIKYYGGIKEAAGQLQIWPQTIYLWGEYPPFGRQCEIEIRTKGALKAETNQVKWTAKSCKKEK